MNRPAQKDTLCICIKCKMTLYLNLITWEWEQVTHKDMMWTHLLSARGEKYITLTECVQTNCNDWGSSILPPLYFTMAPLLLLAYSPEACIGPTGPPHSAAHCSYTVSETKHSVDHDYEQPKWKKKKKKNIYKGAHSPVSYIRGITHYYTV